MINLAIGIAGLVAAVLFLRFAAYRSIEKEYRQQKEKQEKMLVLAAVESSQREFEFVPGEIIQVGKLVHR
ncbi:MAG TPA: hypothetical protein VMD25_03090 [Acidobacteriaceae bacterium]|nr:hypothetical protein [Acidobacteriaceae bacterium]